MNVAIETIQQIDYTDDSEQTEFTRQMIYEIEKQITEIENGSPDSHTDPLQMSTRDFIVESFQMLASLTS